MPAAARAAAASDSFRDAFMSGPPSESRTDDGGDLPAGADPVVSDRGVVAEIVDTGGVLDVEQVLRGDADPRGHPADVDDHAQPGVGQVVGILPAVGR